MNCRKLCDRKSRRSSVDAGLKAAFLFSLVDPSSLKLQKVQC